MEKEEYDWRRGAAELKRARAGELMSMVVSSGMVLAGIIGAAALAGGTTGFTASVIPCMALLVVNRFLLIFGHDDPELLVVMMLQAALVTSPLVAMAAVIVAEGLVAASVAAISMVTAGVVCGAVSAGALAIWSRR